MNLPGNPVQIAFWLGFFAGTLLWVLMARFAPYLRELSGGTKLKFFQFLQNFKTDPRQKYFEKLIPLLQEQHLAASLFALDEILVPPLLLVPPQANDPTKEITASHTTHTTIPQMPDWPEIPSAFGSPTISLAESIRKHDRILVIGKPGSGKSTSLLHLANQIARKETAVSSLDYLHPFYLHSADLSLTPATMTSLKPLIEASAKIFLGSTPNKFSELVSSTLKHKQALIMLDGLDELGPSEIAPIKDYLEFLLQEYPGNHWVLTGSLDYYDGISGLGFFPLALSAWTLQQKQDFVLRWSNLWKTHIRAGIWSDADSTTDESIHIINWLSSDLFFTTPLELTLKVWAAHAGDIVGMSNAGAIKAHIHRLSKGVVTGVAGLERLSTQMVLNATGVITETQAKDFFVSKQEVTFSNENELLMPELSYDLQWANKKNAQVRSQAFNELINRKLIVRCSSDKIRLAHPVFTGYLAGCGLAYMGGSLQIANQAPWATRTLAMQYLANQAEVTPLVNYLLQHDNPIMQNLFQIARWLPEAPKQAGWRISIMRKLVTILQSTETPLGFRSRAMAGLVLSADSAIATFLKKLAKENDPTTRQLAILGLGFLLDQESIDLVTQSLQDVASKIQYSACLALAVIGTDKCFEEVATVLLNGSEELKKAAIEALSINKTIGYEVIREASQMDDILVRRASVYGLASIQESWAIEILQNMVLNDSQWVVKNAATHALDNFRDGSPYLPEPSIPLHQLPWLIMFAGEQGQGITEGKAAMDTLGLALKIGKPIQQMAALDLLVEHGNESHIPVLYQLLTQKNQALQEAAILSLIYLQATGVILVSPQKYGM